jgi:diguanylate cyclase (GGDEF)-like protein
VENASIELSGEQIPSVQEAVEKARTCITPLAQPQEVAQGGAAAQEAVRSLVAGLVEARAAREKEFKKIIWITAEAGAVMVKSGNNYADEIWGFAEKVQQTSNLESVVEIRRQMSNRLTELNDLARRIQVDSAEKAAALKKEMQKVQERLKAAETLAETDTLTKLGNRRMLERRIAAEIAAQNRFCIVMLDLNGFKAVNDRYGHAEGDRLLQSVASALSKLVRGTDMVSRWGGDEFVIVLHDIDLKGAEERVAQIQRKAFGEFMVGSQGGQVNVTACFGIAECALGESADQLFDRADRHLYQMKQALGDTKKRPHAVPDLVLMTPAAR